METEIVVTHMANSTLVGLEQRFSKTRILIGRHPEADIVFDAIHDLSVSGHHAELTVTSEGTFVRDLGSRNGTFVNDQRIESPHPITPNDIVRLGDEGPTFRVGQPAAGYALDKTVAGAAAEKRLVGQETLHRVLEGVVKRERTKSKTHLVLAGAGVFMVVLIIAGALLVQQFSSSKQLVELETKVQGTEAAVQAIRAQADSAIDAKLASFDEELRKLEGDIGQSAGKFGRVMLQIQERDRLLNKLTQRQDISDEQKEILRRETQARLETLGKELNKAEEALRAGTDNNWQKVVEEIAESVFLLVVIDRTTNTPHLGTGFVLEADGLLVTSAQFVEQLRRFPEHLAIQNLTGTVHEILKWETHPDFDGTNRSPGIALIKIETQSPLRPVRIADAKQLESLRVGTHLGTLGYPAELASVYLDGISVKSTVVKGASATFKDGWIGRITNFNLESGDFDKTQIIQHSASLTDGAEGSPLFLASGEVVGIHMDVETVSFVAKLENGKAVVGRSSNPAEIGYALRIDAVESFRRSLNW